MLTVTKRFQFEAAHYLPGYDGDCSRIHGHSYKLEVTVQKVSPLDSDMIIDFKELSRIVKDFVIKRWDHVLLNSLQEFKEERPTAENMVVMVYKILIEEFSDEISIARIRLWETENSYAEYII